MFFQLAKCLSRNVIRKEAIHISLRTLNSSNKGADESTFKTITCTTMSKLLDNLRTEKASIVTEPSLRSAVIAGKNCVYPLWFTRFFNYGPKKLAILGRLIRKKSMNDARKQLEFSKKKYGLDISKALGIIEDDIKNNMRMDPKDFYIKEVIVQPGKSSIKYNFHRPSKLVEVKCRTSRMGIRVARCDIPASELEKSALEIHKLIKERPTMFPWRKPIYGTVKRDVRYMTSPPSSNRSAEPMWYYEMNMWNGKLYSKLKPTKQKVYRLPPSFQATPQTLLHTVASRKRYLRMRASNAIQIRKGQCIIRYR